MVYNIKKSKLKEPKEESEFIIHLVKNKEEARQMAIEYQEWSSKNHLTWGEVARYGETFATLGKKYNLTEEFKENGII